MKKAFTLIELLAVIVIIAIIATIGVFTITKIIDKSRLGALEKTALAVRKATKNYVTANEIMVDRELDLTPGNGNDIPRGSEADIIDLSKDPWGDPYQSVTVSISFVNEQLNVDVQISTNHGNYQLVNNSDELTLLTTLSPCFEFSPNGKGIIGWYPEIPECAGIINIPSGVEFINDYAFRNSINAEVSDIIMPSTVKFIGRSAFDQVIILSGTITLPEGLEHIGEWAFSGRSLTSVSFPSTLKFIGYNAFDGNNFSSISLPNNIEHIEKEAFRNSGDPTNLSVSWPSSNAYIDPTAFNNWLDSGTGDPIIVRDNITHTDPGDCIVISQYGIITSKGANVCNPLIIPNIIDGITLKGIQADVFYNSGITSISLPPSFEMLGRGAFESNPVSEINLPDNLKFIKSYALADTALTDIQFPSSLFLISQGAFQNVNGLASAQIPSTVQYVGCYNSFKECP